MICRHDCFKKFVMNEKSKNKKLMNELIEKFAIKKIIILIYHSQTNEMVEREHCSFVDVLIKMTDQGKKWNEHLHAIF